MAEREWPPLARLQFGFLFSPALVPVVDIFRALGEFEQRNDVAALDQLGDRLSVRLERSSANALILDALLLAFALRRERGQCLRYAPVGSRRGTLDEYRLLALLAAGYWRDEGALRIAIRSLDLPDATSIGSLAQAIADCLKGAGVRLEPAHPILVGGGDARPRSQERSTKATAPVGVKGRRSRDR